jgi:hypothetical protein
MNVIEVIATKRSGHHAMMNWIVKNLINDQIQHWYKITVIGNKSVWLWNDGSKNINEGFKLFNQLIHENQQPPKNLIINYEDTNTDYCQFTENKKFNGNMENCNIFGVDINFNNRVLFIRDFYDNIYSRYLAIKNNVIEDCLYDKNYIDIWKKHAIYYINNSEKCLKYEDWVSNSKKRKKFLLNNFNTIEYHGNENIIGTTTSNVKKENKEISNLPEETKDLIRKDNELHYLIGALGYEYKEI